MQTWWIWFGAHALFIPFVFVRAGRWNPWRAREHEAMVGREVARLEDEEPATA